MGTLVCLMEIAIAQDGKTHCKAQSDHLYHHRIDNDYHRHFLGNQMKRSLSLPKYYMKYPISSFNSN